MNCASSWPRRITIWRRPLKGHVEIDETLVGGRRKAQWPENKTIVMGMLQRDGKIVAAPIPDVTNYTVERDHQRERGRGQHDQH